MAFAAVLLSPVAALAEEDYAEEIQRMRELGLQYDSAWEMYQAMKEKANGGQPMTWPNLPDWSGVYTRTKGGTAFDPDGPPQGEPPSTAKFTPEYHAKMMKTVEDRKRGVEYDPLSQCIPPGYPRWLDMPFLREFIPTPDQTWMFAEAFNSMRRIYTDGRDHIPEEDRYPTENGDSIGFWDGQKLVTHTNQLMAHMYERAQGFYTEQVESVEIWEKIDDATLVGHVWVFDPPALEEPWYTRQSYTKLANDDKFLRIRHWACKGNPNNDVVETEEGGSDFSDFDFIEND
ncbi:hypothetical protein [Elongatibacter sediminis]|uniref:Uncharacterized protein n=1 Tax=Elongatibacter sediminis TaxID=3119006 RepID=A0AAW9R9U4_9GAMM